MEKVVKSASSLSLTGADQSADGILVVTGCVYDKHMPDFGCCW